MRNLAVILLALMLYVYGYSAYGADDLIKKARTDDIIKNGKKSGQTIKSGDLITSPPKGNQKGLNRLEGSQPKGNSSARTSTPSAPNTTATASCSIDVYIGRCPHTKEAVKAVKAFIGKHSGCSVQYYGMKSKTNYDINPSDIEGIEIYLPVDARRFDITTIPSFVITVGGVAYRVSGAADIEDIYREITGGKASGQKRDGYIDLGDRGKGCGAVHVDLSPVELTPRQIREVNAESKPPDAGQLKALKDRVTRVNVPHSGRPLYLTRQANMPFQAARFIAFTRADSKSSLVGDELKNGAWGCCTDCDSLEELKEFKGRVQYCTPELLKSLGITSVPAVVKLSP